ncbi:MAG: alpha/beta hydrolase, partial [Liquorilactobacillus satsumensis]
LMIFNIQEETIKVDAMEMDYIVFGNGTKPLVVLPGLGDGLKTVKGQSIPLAIFYKKYLKKFRIYAFSRRVKLPQNYTTREMARDQKIVLNKLGLDKFYLMGISQGGMIAQHLAIEYPDGIEKLILAVTTSKPTKEVRNRIPKWIQFATLNDYKSLLIDAFENMYTNKKLKLYRPFYSLISKASKPKDFNRFIIQAKSCLSHDTTDELQEIKTPTLIVGAVEDKIVGYDISIEMATRIKNSKFISFEKYGHAVYEECKDFNTKIIDFLLE